MELSEMIKVMQHFEDGGEIKCIEIGCGDWEEMDSPGWDWYNYNYRIKEPKQKVTIEKWLCRDNQGGYIVLETSGVFKFKKYIRVKLIESYEIEL